METKCFSMHRSSQKKSRGAYLKGKITNAPGQGGRKSGEARPNPMLLKTSKSRKEHSIRDKKSPAVEGGTSAPGSSNAQLKIAEAEKSGHWALMGKKTGGQCLIPKTLNECCHGNATKKKGDYQVPYAEWEKGKLLSEVRGVQNSYR